MAYLIMAFLAGAGFLASLGCHIIGLLQIEPPWGKSVFILHVGIFVVWIPLVFSANRTMPKRNRGNFDHLLVELPKWVRIATRVVFVYAAVNFVFFLVCASQYPKHKVPFTLELRGFSGHWLLFYGWATAGFIGLSRRARKLKLLKESDLTGADKCQQ